MDALIDFVEKLLQEPRPDPVGTDSPVLDGPSPVDHATAGFRMAVTAVAKANHAVATRDWEERQRILREWLAHLEGLSLPDSDEVVEKILRGDDVDLGAALVGTSRWEEMFDQIHDLHSWARTRAEETMRKYKAFADGFTRIATIVSRCKQRMSQVLRSAEEQSAKLSDSDVDSRNAITARVRLDLTTVSEMAVQRINVQTRQVLDLDENTASISVEDWLTNHGLETGNA